MSIKTYHESISDELIAVATRVRQFVENWTEDGNHHEAVLKTVIRKFLPKRFELGTGFVIKPTSKRGEHTTSKQIDIIIYDSNYPTLFKEGDFVIATPDAVKGIISVKANLENQNKPKTYNDCNFNGQFIHSGKRNKNEYLFNGLFSFDGFNSHYSEFKTIENSLQNSFNEFYDSNRRKKYVFEAPEERRYILNHISINKDYFVKHWNSQALGEQEYVFYYIKNISYSYFISNLMDYLTVENESVNHNNFIWYPDDKSNSKLKTFYLEKPK